tara:strand:- start:57861 stop:58589 length:729 start_codon:yes stop_codon:yes gene_type:complete
MLDYFLENFSKEINGIIHVGAHSGQEVLKYKAYDKKIILFEPQKSIYKELLKNVASLQEVQCYNIGLGSVKKKSTLFKSNENEGKSSSVLTPELHLKVQPNISFTDSEEIKIERFDSLEVETLNFVTLDVQGFELEVLKGFGEELKKVEFIFTEINTRYLYKNNALVSDIDKYLEKFGFFRIFTNVDCFNYFGDAFYIKETNKLYSQNTLNKIKNKLYISNLFLHFKKLSYPRRLTKSLLRK